ncbi:Putative ABC transporter [Acididesulfobacillus acetoxydans]|uniref:ABC transporter n=1 Tax=Acididesulfobacillus acetoxydans TaxID=1561005 RepID=A0A8S0W2V7_9FIRM|nr:dipeptide ABC transporter ATP-binding protein [Acididesulfobacillus acetoxydans]CAA7601058.1 Putative ABC transporter [Acididesulfobacillus acetoxydans]CEJ06932.1 Oligopeptide transport ATP-binding protein AppF [Acididesulfobacillus acetoxydans]
MSDPAISATGTKKVTCREKGRFESDTVDYTASPLLDVRELKKHFPVRTKDLFRPARDFVRAVDGVSFFINPGETLALVGESGSGKSTTARLILRLLEPTAGEILFEGRSLGRLGPEMMRQARKQMQMIFQDPYASLNPRLTVEEIIAEPLQIFHVGSPVERSRKVSRLLDIVGLASRHAKRYPHEFSGGQRQRIGIARALALNPKLIIGDEPVSALDVSIQAQVLNLLKDLQEEFGLTYLFIAHDLSVVEFVSDRVAVMYLGIIVEMADKETLFRHPLHPYTQALLSAVPVPDPDCRRERIILPGDIPSPVNPPAGCRFHPRCQVCREVCRREAPVFREVKPGHYVACHIRGQGSEARGRKEEVGDGGQETVDGGGT